MPASPLNPRRVVPVIAALLALHALLPGRFASWAGAVVQPVVATLSVPARPIRGLGAQVRARAPRDIDRPDDLNLFTDLRTALAEVDRLEQLNDRLRDELAQLGPMRAILEEFGFAELTQVTARVTGNAGTAATPLLLIGAGSMDGVAAGQTVVYRLGVVGRITEDVGPMSAAVALVTGHPATLAVRVVAPSEGEGARRVVLPGRLTATRVRIGPEGDVFIADEVPHDADVRIGDHVRLADELNYVEARGFLLGRVTAVQNNPNNPELLQKITVAPAFDLANLTRVTVLVPGASDPP